MKIRKQLLLRWWSVRAQPVRSREHFDAGTCQYLGTIHNCNMKFGILTSYSITAANSALYSSLAMSDTDPSHSTFNNVGRDQYNHVRISNINLNRGCTAQSMYPGCI